MTATSHRAEHSPPRRLRRACGLALLAGLPGAVVATAHAAPVHAGPSNPSAPSAPPETSALPYGGQLNQPGSGVPGDGSSLDIGMLGLGGVEALALVGAGVVDRWRGPTAEQTRRALMTRTDPGKPSGPRPTRPATRRTSPAITRQSISGGPRPSGAHRRVRGLRAA